MTTRHNDDDPRVSGTYREFAREKTPAELDDKVLAMAAGAARTRYGLTRAWIRPVAWAATIGLSLAFILEMSQIQDVPTAEPVSVTQDKDRTGMERRERDDTPELMKVSAPPADSAPAAPAAAKREARTPAAAEPALIQPMTASEDRAAFAAVAEEKEQTSHCDAEARGTPGTWYECIEVLREEGLADAANAELEALRDAFPDFREPARK